MATLPDWVKLAALDIVDACDLECHSNLETVEDLIRSHCPFKPDTLYQEVPVCPTCHTQLLVEEFRLGRYSLLLHCPNRCKRSVILPDSSGQNIV